MARTDAMAIYQADGSTLQKLSEVYAGVLDNFQTQAISSQIKNTQYSGDPKSGSVEFDRILNTAVENYDPDATDVNPSIAKVTVNVNTPKMIRERVTQWDLDQYGIPNLVERKRILYANSMTAFADRQYFAQAESEATEVTLEGATDQAKLDELIRSITDAQTDYADGVDESMVVLSLKSSLYDSLKSMFYLYPNNTDGALRLADYNGVRIYRNFRQTVDAIATVRGSGALPIAPIGVAVDKIPGSVEYYVGLYFKYGVKMIMPELVNKVTTWTEVSA